MAYENPAYQTSRGNEREFFIAVQVGVPWNPGDRWELGSEGTRTKCRKDTQGAASLLICCPLPPPPAAPLRTSFLHFLSLR